MLRGGRGALIVYCRKRVNETMAASNKMQVVPSDSNNTIVANSQHAPVTYNEVSYFHSFDYRLILH